MYNIEKRKQFSTVGELRELLKDYPENTEVLICGDSYAWLHVEQDECVICLDNEDLDECYEDENKMRELISSQVKNNSYSSDYLAIRFTTRGEAESFLSKLDDILSANGKLTKADFFTAYNYIPLYTDKYVGWTNLDEAHVVRHNSVYKLLMPKCESLITHKPFSKND